MNKLKLLYDIARTMKNREKLGGVLQVKVHKDLEEVFTLRNQFEKDGAGKAKTTVSSELNLDGHHMTRQSSTEFNVGDHCCHGAGMMRRFFHGGHETARCGGIKGFFGRLSCALGVLNSIQAEEREDGSAALTLNLDELPEEMRGGLLERLQQKAAHCSHHGFLADCRKVEGLHGQIVVEVNEKRKIERITLELDGTTQDAENEHHSVTASGEVQFAS